MSNIDEFRSTGLKATLPRLKMLDEIRTAKDCPRQPRRPGNRMVA